MTKSAYCLMLLFLIISSCRLTEKDLVGIYKLDKFPKTTLKIASDKTFEFSKNNRNPYLHPFDHPDEYFFETKGSWQWVNRKTISLTSQSDTLIYPIVSVQLYAARDSSLSYFTFYDNYGDTVQVLYLQYSDSSTYAVLHRSMDYFTEDMTKRDTLEFHFYGYPPYTLVTTNKINQDYRIELKPSFKPSYFQSSEFLVKRSQLIDKKRNGKFRRSSSGM